MLPKDKLDPRVARTKTFLASLEPQLLEARSLTLANLQHLGVTTYTFLAKLHSCSNK